MKQTINGKEYEIGLDADLVGANFRGANLVGAFLGGADLGGANLVGANLVGADLVGANLVGANFRGADLGGANFRGANLVGAFLGGADLGGADLAGANLVGAYLVGAYLRGADLKGIVVAWRSCDLIAEILRRAATTPAQEQLAGWVLIKRGWCWKDWATVEHPEREWALAELRKWVQHGDGAPEILTAEEE